MTDETTTAPPPITERQYQLLSEEINRLQALYLDAHSGIQSVFNFYLTFLTAVIGVIVFIVENDGALNNGVLIVLLFFATLVGTVYLSAISGRYGHTARFARALDALRHQQMIAVEAVLPDLYESFTHADHDGPVPPQAWYLWLLPTGTYQMFMGVVNAGALAIIILLLARAGEVGGGATAFAMLLTFFLTLTICNAYSRLVIQRFIGSLDVRVDMSGVLGGWAARQ